MTVNNLWTITKYHFLTYTRTVVCDYMDKTKTWQKIKITHFSDAEEERCKGICGLNRGMCVRCLDSSCSGRGRSNLIPLGWRKSSYRRKLREAKPAACTTESKVLHPGDELTLAGPSPWVVDTHSMDFLIQSVESNLLKLSVPGRTQDTEEVLLQSH